MMSPSSQEDRPHLDEHMAGVSLFLDGFGIQILISDQRSTVVGAGDVICQEYLYPIGL